MFANLRIENNKADRLGMVSGTICLIHCMATPFLFLVKASSHAHAHDEPSWWHVIDYVFIVISFIAIYFATKKASNKRVTTMMWFSWVLLLLVIVNETIEYYALPEIVEYIPAILIIGLHFYNHKYCKCSGDSCCLDLKK